MRREDQSHVGFSLGRHLRTGPVLGCPHHISTGMEVTRHAADGLHMADTACGFRIEACGTARVHFETSIDHEVLCLRAMNDQ